MFGALPGPLGEGRRDGRKSPGPSSLHAAPDQTASRHGIFPARPARLEGPLPPVPGPAQRALPHTGPGVHMDVCAHGRVCTPDGHHGIALED